MAEKLDLYRLQFSDWREYLLQRKDHLFEIETEEGPFIMEGCWVHLNMMICMPLITRKQPISRKRHLIYKQIYSAKLHSKKSSAIRKDLIKNFDRMSVQREILMTMQDAHNTCYTHIGSYIRGINIFDLGDVILDKELNPLFTIDVSKEREKGIDAVEQKIQHEAKFAVGALMDDKNKWNVLYAPLKCGVLKTDQFHQVVMMIGSRTDVDEYIFPQALECSYLSGFRNITDLAIESRSGAKAGHYNKTQMSEAQYLNRRIQILCIDDHKLHKGDCGSTLGTEYLVEEADKARYLGKYMFDRDGGLTILTEDNIDSVVGKTIKVRSTGTCRHDDGYCHVCGGELTENFPDNINVGTTSNVESGQKVAQNVLSTKHFLMANMTEYDIPDALENYLQRIGNGIYFRRSCKDIMDKLAIGFQPRDIARIEDIRLVKDTSAVTPDYFSEIKYLNIGKVEPDGTVTSQSTRVPMKGKGDVYPYLSPEVLQMIEQHPDVIARDPKIVWIKLNAFDITTPVFRYSIVNDSIIQFTKDLSNFVSKEIGKYTSYSAAVHVLRDFLWKRKIDTHITHIETIIKSFLITGDLDYSIGVIENPDNVRFGTLGRTIPRRSIGAQFVFERTREYMASPTISTIPKKSGQFDEFMGYSDICERDRFWPPGSVVMTMPDHGDIVDNHTNNTTRIPS